MTLSSADITFKGLTTNELSGYSTAGAGDVNGDGYDDVLISAPGTTASGKIEAGKSYLIYGGIGLETKLDPTGNMNLSEADVTFSGAMTGDSSGISVAGAGDINGDGYDDILIGAPAADLAAGKSYLIYGGTGLSASLSLANANIVTFNGIETANESGKSVSAGGDVNGDGYDDILIGAPSSNTFFGETYLIYGKSDLLTSQVLSSADVTLSGVADSDENGYSVAAAGDVNDDGYADILIGDFGPNTYLVYGGSDLSTRLSLSNADVTLNSTPSVGHFVAGAGDVNNDGYDDVLIGSPGINGDAGETYLFLGHGK